MDFFAKSTTWLAETAGVRGVDWAALAAKNQDSVLNTQYMDQYLLPAFKRCAAVIDTLHLPRDGAAQTIANYFEVKAKVSGVADDMLRAGMGVITLIAPPVGGIIMGFSSYSTMIWHLWCVALSSANMHITAQIHKSGIPDADIAFHASLTTMMFNLITRLDDYKLLTPFKKNGSSTNGLGAAPAVIILAAVAIIAFAWAIVAIYETAKRNAVIEKACQQAADSGDPAAIANCQKLFSTTEGQISATVPKAISDVVEKVSIAAMLGAGVYALIYFGPGIATKVKQSIAAWKAG